MSQAKRQLIFILGLSALGLAFDAVMMVYFRGWHALHAWPPWSDCKENVLPLTASEDH